MPPARAHRRIHQRAPSERQSFGLPSLPKHTHRILEAVSGRATHQAAADAVGYRVLDRRKRKQVTDFHMLMYLTLHERLMGKSRSVIRRRGRGARMVWYRAMSHQQTSTRSRFSAQHTRVVTHVVQSLHNDSLTPLIYCIFHYRMSVSPFAVIITVVP